MNEPEQWQPGDVAIETGGELWKRNHDRATTPDWITPGTEVLLYTIQPGVEGTSGARKSTIDRVTTKTFTITDPNEPRFRISRCRNGECSAGQGGTWGPTRYVVPLDSDIARREITAANKRNRSNRAYNAVDKWQREPTNDHRLKAIAALQALEVDEEP